MATAKFTIGQVNITQKLRVIAREVSNPTVESANVIYNEPHPTSRQIVIDGLNPTMHYFDFYETLGGSTVGTLLGTFTIEVGFFSSAAFSLLEFNVDGGLPNDPVAGDTEYNNTDLVEATLQITQRGIGPRSFIDEIEPISTGGFRLLNGETFQAADKWFVLVSKIIVQAPIVISKSIFSAIAVIPSNTTLSSTHFNKLLIANGSATILRLTFPDFASIPDGTVFGFNTQRGDQRYLELVFPTGTYSYILGEQKEKVWLGKCEEIAFYKNGSELIILWADGDIRRVGEIVKGDISPVNGLQETGGWKNIADYPRFFYWFVNKIPNGQLAAKTDIDASVDTEMAKFSIDSVGEKFWMPDTGGYFERNTDPDSNVDTDRGSNNTPGTKQNDEFKSHGHGIKTSASGASTNDNADPVRSSMGGSKNTKGQAGDNKTIELSGGNETRGKNIAHNSYRII
jgi:hypothetical protein